MQQLIIENSSSVKFFYNSMIFVFFYEFIKNDDNALFEFSELTSNCHVILNFPKA